MANQHWAILTIDQILTATGYKIVVTTDVPCHLYMRWSTNPPWIHHVPIERRGVFLKTDIQICFTVFEDNQQEEAGDTTTHTFIKEPWASCETRWFYFHGTIGGIASPSTSAIFKKHRVGPAFGPPETHYFYPDPDPEVTSVDGWLDSRPSPRPQDWDFVRAGNLVYPHDDHVNEFVAIYCDRYTDMWYWILREIQLYDTSPIPADSLINDAKLRLLGDYKATNVNFPNAGIVVVTSNPASNTQLIAADWHTFGATMLTNIISQDDYNAAGYNTFTFTPDGLAAIIANGITKLGLIESGYDLPNIKPTWGRLWRTTFSWQSADTLTPADRPRLEVTYQPPL